MTMTIADRRKEITTHLEAILLETNATVLGTISQGLVTSAMERQAMREQIFKQGSLCVYAIASWENWKDR